MLDHMPSEVLGRLPLSQSSLATLACVNTTLRKLVAQAWGYRHVVVAETFVGHVTHLGALALTVTGPSRPCTVHPSPCPVPTSTTSLRLLELTHARVYTVEFWATVLYNAPNLTDVIVHPLMLGDHFDESVVACYALMRLGADRLRRLEIRGIGFPLCRHSSQRVLAAPLIRFPKLHTLVLTGRQLHPFVEAPCLVNAHVEETNTMPKVLYRMTGPTRGTLVRLQWVTPVDKLPLPHMPSLRVVDLAIRDIRTPSEFRTTLASLRALPPTLTSLRVTLDFHSMMLECPLLDWGSDALTHLAELERLDIRVSFPTPRVGVLVRDLLGASSIPTLRHVSLHALAGPAEAHKSLRAEMSDEDADPEDPDVVDLDLVIASIEGSCRLPVEDIRACLQSLTHTRLDIRGFALTATPCRMPRLHVHDDDSCNSN